jgi:tail protein X
MNDPVQVLIQSGAIPATPFGPSSRYAGVPIGRYQLSTEDSVPYVLRRFVPQAREIPLATNHLVRAGDRIDVIAGHYLGDAELHWRVADANPGTGMLELTATAGVRVAIPLPAGS